MFGILKEFSVRDSFYQDVRSLVVYIELENRLGLFAFVRTACQKIGLEKQMRILTTLKGTASGKMNHPFLIADLPETLSFQTRIYEWFRLVIPPIFEKLAKTQKTPLYCRSKVFY